MGLLKKTKKEGETKPKKVLWKRILKWTGISFLVLLIILIIAPFIFKPQIIDQIEKAANNNLNATVEIGDVDLSIFSSFPNFTLTLKDVKIQGKGVFEEITLADLPELEAKLNLWSVVGGGNYKIDKVKLVDPQIHIKVFEDGTANYDIALPDSSKAEPEEEVPFEMALTEYEIVNGNFIYDDASVATFVEVQELNHTGGLNINGAVYDITTQTTATNFTLAYDDVAYISKADLVADADMVIDMTTVIEMTLKENHIDLNALKFHADGGIVLDDRGTAFKDFKFAADEASFADFLSMIPEEYAVDMSGMKTSGSMAMKGVMDGYMADDAMPAMDFHFDINNGMVQYPGMPSNISNLNIDANIVKADDAVNFDGMVINVPKLNADFAGNTLRSSMAVKTPESDPNIEATLKTNVDLATLKNVIPDMEDLNGLLQSDIYINGKLSAIDNEQYEQFQAKGDLLLSGMDYVSEDLPAPLEIDTLRFKFTPQAMEMPRFAAKIGENDFNANGKVNNYLGYLFREELLAGEFNVTSNYFNADDFMVVSDVQAESAIADGEVSQEEAAIPIPSNIDFELHTAMKEVVYNKIPITNIKGDIHVKDAKAELKALTLNAFGGDVEMNGSYDTKNESKPHVEMGYKLKSIDIAQAVAGFSSIEQLAAITKYCDGKISSEFDFNGDLTANMEPVMNSLIGGGDLRSSKIDISGFAPLEKMSQALNRKNLASQTVENVNMKFEFLEGKIGIKPFDVKISNYNANISGTTSFEQDLDYTIVTKVPKSQLPKSAINAAEKAMGQASSLGLNLAQLPNEIPVDVLMTGKVTDPKISTNLKEQLLSLTGNLTDQIKDQIKDTISAVVEEKVEEIKDDLKERRDKLLADAQKQADNLKAGATTSADKIRSEADKAYDETIKAAGSNPLKKKAAEIAGKKVKEKAYEKAQKLEDEADVKADNIMKTAREKGDKLE